LVVPGKNASDAEKKKFRKDLETATEKELELLARSLQAGGDKERYIHMSDLASKDDQDGDGILQWVQLVMAGEPGEACDNVWLMHALLERLYRTVEVPPIESLARQGCRHCN
jgi:hypothetical protein